MNANKIFDRHAEVAGLAWGVHLPFREYVQRMSDGQTTVDEGAEILDSGEVFFPRVADDTAACGELRFQGRLEFVGHHGMMVVSLAQPWIEASADHCQLSIVDPFEPAERMFLVEIEFGEEATGTTRLTEAGTDLFMGNYHEKTLFDPVRIVWAEKDQQK